YDGFILPINATTGVPANADIYGTAAQEYLSSINPSASTPVGYVIGGLSEDASTKTNDMWALKIDATNAVIWNTKRDYNNVLTKNTEKPMDIIERRNTLRQYEYYQIGQTNGSIYGGMDMIVYKLDNNGANVATGQFTYQGAGSDWGGAIDFANPATNGLAIFGSHEYTGTEIREFWLVRAYYNGVTACNYDRRNLATAQSGPPYLTSLSVSQTGSFSVSNLTSALPSVNDNDDEICYVLNVAIGSNARTAPTENNTGVLISPNPMGHNSAAATVTLEAATDEQATVTIYDVLGKQYYINNFMLKNGKNSLSLDLSGAGMAPGIYSVRISGEATNKTIVLLIK
ncbi:MAG TPA: T9SS type A sorting domain-containing protein, partial [Bacteroidia bacterium]|nr:T9SS type A sorting domain-containing protein [Bacteroidia bacterium]